MTLNIFHLWYVADLETGPRRPSRPGRGRPHACPDPPPTSPTPPTDGKPARRKTLQRGVKTRLHNFHRSLISSRHLSKGNNESAVFFLRGCAILQQSVCLSLSRRQRTTRLFVLLHCAFPRRCVCFASSWHFGGGRSSSISSPARPCQ